MTWITQNKGAGPWPFQKQEEKCGYVNNPRWTGVPASEVIHEPCGYWPKGSVGTSANLFGLTSNGGEIWAVSYDGNALSWVGSYDSPIDANGLAFYSNNLITIAGTGATAVIREVSTTPPLSNVSDYSVLLANDLPNVDTYTTILRAPNIDKYFVVGGGVNGRIIRLSKDLTREARGVYGTVVEGTDGHLYILTSVNFTWTEANKPVTGANWDVFWDPISDDVCDSPLTTWGVDPKYPTYSGATAVTYHNGYLYFSLSQSVNYHALRKIDPSTLAITASADRTIAGKLVGYGDNIYVLEGVVNARVRAYRASDLVEVADSGILSYGRFVGGIGNGDLAVVNGRLIVTSIPYTGNSALYALDLTTLAVLEVSPYNVGAGGPVYQCLAQIDGDTVVIAENDGVGIAYLNGLKVPTGKTQLLEGGSPPYLSFGKHLYPGISQQWVLVRSASSGGGTSVSGRCGTSPVWPMPS